MVPIDLPTDQVVTANDAKMFPIYASLSLFGESKFSDGLCLQEIVMLTYYAFGSGLYLLFKLIGKEYVNALLRRFMP